MPPRYLHTASLLNNGVVLFAGGLNADSLASAELYTPDSLTPSGLVSITIDPLGPTLSPGTTQKFVAIGTFSDNSTQVLQSVTWNSATTAVATITNDASNRGVTLAIAAGTTTITACTAAICGSATLAVTPAAGFVFTGPLGKAPT